MLKFADGIVKRWVMRMWLNISGIVLMALVMGWHRPFHKHDPPSTALLATCDRFREMYRNVGDSLVTPDSAMRAFRFTVGELRAGTSQYKDSCNSSADNFIFPLRGYTPRSSIGGRGRGYRPNGFDFFDARVRKSHPAHDLFIRDGNQDDIDDRMCSPVDVLAFTEGIVVATEDGWLPGNLWRGGNYVWIYNPCRDALLYYAHNSRIYVKPGQWVSAGEKIAEVGRTGFNAYQARSGTHLHLMYLKLTEEGLPEPVNTYGWLMDSAVREWED